MKKKIKRKTHYKNTPMDVKTDAIFAPFVKDSGMTRTEALRRIIPLGIRTYKQENK